MEPPAGTLPRSRSRLAASFRSPHNWQQLGKFAVVGAIGVGINVGVFRTLIHHGVHYIVAATVSFLVAVTSNYTWNRVWTFRDHRGHLGIQGMRFFLVSAAALGANLLALQLFVGLGLDKVIAQVIAIAIVMPLNFIGNKLWSFRKRGH